MDNKIGTRSFQQQESIQPPSYNSVINTHIPQPNISFLQTSPRPVNQNINYGLQAIGKNNQKINKVEHLYTLKIN